MFSIIIPVHNKLPHLDRTIQSVMRQSFKEFEVILIDDASNDGSSEKIREYTDPKIRVFKREIPGPGGYAARNLGIKEAKYDWIAFLDADDEWSKDYLKEVRNGIQKNLNTQMATTEWIRTTEPIEDEIIETDEQIAYAEFDLIDYLEKPKYIWTGAVVVHKDVVSKAGGFPVDKLCKRGGDVDTWIRWLTVSNKNILIKKVLSYYHQGTVNQVTGKPNTHFCAYETLKDIYKNSNDKALKRATSRFSNKFIYNMLARQVKSGSPIRLKEFKKMYIDSYSFLRIFKLYYFRFLYLMKK